MLNATQATSIPAALEYFTNVLSQGDYYLGTEVNGHFHGKAASQLGMKKKEAVSKVAFKVLLEGRHPRTGKKLTQRLRKDRRPGIDLTFSPPKSVSLLWTINRDERIVDLLREAVYETMSKDVEPLVCRRLRSGKHAATKDRKPTGNFIYADFLHKTSRPVDGNVDPHLHIHAFVMNLTRDGDRFYAAELEEVLRQMPALQAKFEARLARKLIDQCGYEVEAVQFFQSRKLKTGWEVKGIDRKTIEKFSTRTAQIEAYAEEHNIKSDRAKGKLGATTRSRKESEANLSQLRREWYSRLSGEERVAFENLSEGAIGSGKTRDRLHHHKVVNSSIQFALDHHLYRSSVVERHKIIGTALEQGISLLPEEVEEALERTEVIRAEREEQGTTRHYVTTEDILQTERDMIAFAREGRGTTLPIAQSPIVFNREWLNHEQKSAVEQILTSKDRVIAVAGGAGTGKSSLMQEAADIIKTNHKRLYVFAPSTGGKEVLEEKGFSQAQTVEHLLRNEQLQSKLQGAVLWIDEAGLLDLRSMSGIFAIAKAQNARVVLSGDTRQHASPRRGEALRLLESEAGLNIARVETIQRQKGRYKEAIELVSRGHEVIDPATGMTGMLAGFDLLDQLGKIRQIAGDDRHDELAKNYLAATEKQKSTLVVSPTHAEGEAATEAIRSELRRAGAIGTEDTFMERLKSLNLSEAEKSQATTYHGRNANLIVQFHQNVTGGYVRGERYVVVTDQQGRPHLESVNGKLPKPIPYAASDRFEVYTRTEVPFAKGDKIRFSLGGKSIEGIRISNGRLDEIAGFDSEGNLKLKSGITVSQEYGHFDLGYVVTSHSAQGKDRQLAIASIGRESLPAVNAKQFYVTTSRGKEDVMIFVDDKEAVRRSIQKAGEQLSATELVKTQQAAQKRVMQQQRHRRAVSEQVRHWWTTNLLGHVQDRKIGNSRQLKSHPYFPTAQSPSFGRS